jgi:hypothetical protein
MSPTAFSRTPKPKPAQFDAVHRKRDATHRNIKTYTFLITLMPTKWNKFHHACARAPSNPCTKCRTNPTLSG